MAGFEDEARTGAFAYVDATTLGGEEPITWDQLRTFEFLGERVHLASQQGIFKPRQFTYPVSIRTTPPPVGGPPPYEDEIALDGYLHYAYRGTDQQHPDNVLLRRAMDDGVPLLYLHGIARGSYHVHGAIIDAGDPGSLRFRVALMPITSLAYGAAVELDAQSATRRHYMQLVKVRANQQAFRERVLTAYRTTCSVCRLRHRELLDAAHILPFGAGGAPVVTNGISMCKIHHAAYDANILGVRPDMTAEIRVDVLQEVDGPMLTHGLQEAHNAKLLVPTRKQWRPDSEALVQRYEQFRAAG